MLAGTFVGGCIDADKKHEGVIRVSTSTRISDLQVIRVLEGDTFRVETEGGEESLRLACVVTEENQAGSNKSVTRAGRKASDMAKKYFGTETRSQVRVELEFDTYEPPGVRLEKHRDNFGRLLCYVHKGEENYNLKLMRDGWSPYFVMYGRSEICDVEFLAAEAEAQANRLAVWDPVYNGTGVSGDLHRLLLWWGLRASVVADYRRLARPEGVLSVKLDYQRLLEAIPTDEIATVLCNLQEGVKRWLGGALAYAGSPQHKFNLLIPGPIEGEKERLIKLLEKRHSGQDEEPYSGLGRGYVNVSGDVSEYEEGNRKSC